MTSGTHRAREPWAAGVGDPDQDYQAELRATAAYLRRREYEAQPQVYKGPLAASLDLEQPSAGKSFWLQI